MLKHLLVSLLLSAATVPAFAQATTTTNSQPKQFCRLTVRLRGGGSPGNTADSEMHYGEESKLTPLTDTQLAEEAAKVKALDSETLVLDYLSSRGWEVIGFNSINSYYTIYMLQRPLK
ncbi:MAG: hypothetical protein ACRYFX_04535 [Janthinobacterium lividum]